MTLEEKIKILENIRDILLKYGTTQENLDKICADIDKNLVKLIASLSKPSCSADSLPNKG